MKFSSVAFATILATILVTGTLSHPIIQIHSGLIGKLAVPLLSIGGSIATGVVISELYLKNHPRLIPELSLGVAVPSHKVVKHPLAHGHGSLGLSLH